MYMFIALQYYVLMSYHYFQGLQLSSIESIQSQSFLNLTALEELFKSVWIAIQFSNSLQQLYDSCAWRKFDKFTGGNKLCARVIIFTSNVHAAMLRRNPKNEQRENCTNLFVEICRTSGLLMRAMLRCQILQKPIKL